MVSLLEALFLQFQPAALSINCYQNIPLPPITKSFILRCLVLSPMKPILQPEKCLSIAMHKILFFFNSDVGAIETEVRVFSSEQKGLWEIKGDYFHSHSSLSLQGSDHAAFFVLRSGITWKKDPGKEFNNSSWSQESRNKTLMYWVSKMLWWVSFQVFYGRSN